MKESVLARPPMSAGHRGLLCLAAILLLSSTLKLAVWGFALPTPTRFQDPDSSLYHSSARSLLHLGSFTPSTELPGVAETRRTPGYPLFLAGSYALLGESFPAALLLQILISAGTIALVYWLAWTLWTPASAVAAALLLALDVASLTSSVKLMSDTLFTFLVTAMLAAGVVLLRAPRKTPPALALGALLMAATFVRPVTYYLVVPLALGVLAVAVAKRWRWSTSAAVLASILVPYVLGVGAWQVRNGRLTGSYQFSSFEGFNLLYYRGAAVVALRDGISLGEARAELGLERGHREFALENGWTPARDEAWKRQAFALFLDHPLLFVRAQVPGAVRLLLAPGEGGLLRMLGVPVGTPSDAAGYLRRFATPAGAVVSAWALLYLAVLHTGVLSWAWARLSDRISLRKSKRVSGRGQRPGRGIRPADLFLWGVLLYFVAISAGQGGARFRLPVMPVLALYSARGLGELGRRFRSPSGFPPPGAPPRPAAGA